MNLLTLYLTFFKIGCVAYGGGYAMIPLLQREVVEPGWLSLGEFLDMMAISEMTPGPIAVNTATFVGYRLFGLLGGAVATIAVISPSLILTFVLLRFLARYQDHPITGKAMAGIHVAVVILIISAALYIVPAAIIDLKTLALAIATFLLVSKTKVNPILLIFLGGAAGILLGT
ncbi:MAG: chromate transporter [Firmicutes bacterium]|nr:chromate transporter [Bacillota bacterium]